MPAEAPDPSPGWTPTPRQGWVAPRLSSEFPGLGIAWVEVDSKPRRSPEPVRRRLQDLSNRTYGSQAIRLRERPIPWAYRVFYRQIGLDPDRTRTAVEQLTLDRLHDGGFLSHGLPTDALTIATVETGVALRALDAESIEGYLCIRDTAPGERLAGEKADLPAGTLAIADDVNPIGLLFGATAEDHRVEPGTRRVAVVSVQVKGVPQIAVEEALWMAAGTLEAG